MKRIAIIGGGAGGTLALVQLIRQTGTPLAITLYDAKGDFARGVAYSTKRREHVLNVRAHRMGAFPDTPEDFVRWLSTEAGTQAQNRWCEAPLAKEDFAPRGLYGEYLAELLREACAEAPRKGIAAELARADITAARWNGAQFTLHGSDGATTQADAVILACGTQSPPAAPGVIEAWEWFKSAPGTKAEAQLAQAEHVVLIGSGLTMVDSALSLKRIGFRGRITALSRHAALPAAHDAQDPPPYPAWALTSPGSALRGLRAYMQQLRQEVAEATHKGSGWREVVDSLRAATPALWRSLPPREQRVFFARLFTLWNVHRHRMAPQLRAELEDMIHTGRLTLTQGYVTEVTPEAGRMRVAYRKDGAAQSLAADAVIRCTGPAYDVTRNAHPLLAQLLRDGLIVPSAAGAGIATTAAYGARGPAQRRLHAMGALLVGDWLECTAMPELRAQARDIAASLLA